MPSRQVTHFDSSSGLHTVTACGKSLHGYSIRRPKNVTKKYEEVTCKACDRALNTPKSR